VAGATADGMAREVVAVPWQLSARPRLRVTEHFLPVLREEFRRGRIAVGSVFPAAQRRAATALAFLRFDT